MCRLPILADAFRCCNATSNLFGATLRQSPFIPRPRETDPPRLGHHAYGEDTAREPQGHQAQGVDSKTWGSRYEVPRMSVALKASPFTCLDRAGMRSGAPR